MTARTFSTPPNQPSGLDPDAADDLLGDDMTGADTAGDMDDMVDGDRQLSTNSDAIDGGLNDSDLGSPRDTGMADSLGVDGFSADPTESR